MSGEPDIKTLAPWFGSNRQSAYRVGQELGSLAWCGVPFAGGCSEIRHIKCRAGVASDLHRHLINLATVVREEALRLQLCERLSHALFHETELLEARRRLAGREVCEGGSIFTGEATATQLGDVAWAFDYFVSCWMGQGAAAGKVTEFRGDLSVRWTSSGGDSAKRFASAAASLHAWGRSFSNWNFMVCNAFEFLPRIVDDASHGVYADPPWPDAGKEYKHRFTLQDQRNLARALSRFERARVVVRFGDHPLIRELYPEGEGPGKWTWLRHVTRSQQNTDVNEVLLINGPARSKEVLHGEEIESKERSEVGEAAGTTGAGAG